MQGVSAPLNLIPFFSEKIIGDCSNSTGRLGLMKIYLSKAVNPDGTQEFIFFSDGHQR